jgi:hypothetical protein
VADLAEAQRISDERLIAWSDAAEQARLQAEVEMVCGDDLAALGWSEADLFRGSGVDARARLQ